MDISIFSGGTFRYALEACKGMFRIGKRCLQAVNTRFGGFELKTL